MHLLSTACTAERREKSHRHDACGRKKRPCVNKGGCQQALCDFQTVSQLQNIACENTLPEPARTASRQWFLSLVSAAGHLTMRRDESSLACALTETTSEEQTEGCSTSTCLQFRHCHCCHCCSWRATTLSCVSALQPETPATAFAFRYERMDWIEAQLLQFVCSSGLTKRQRTMQTAKMETEIQAKQRKCWGCSSFSRH